MMGNTVDASCETLTLYHHIKNRTRYIETMTSSVIYGDKPVLTTQT